MVLLLSGVSISIYKGARQLSIVPGLPPGLEQEREQGQQEVAVVELVVEVAVLAAQVGLLVPEDGLSVTRIGALVNSNA